MPDTRRDSTHDATQKGPDATAERHRKIQAEQDRRDAKQAREQKPQAKGAPQTGRAEPEQLPAQHLRKPGLEAELAEKPRFQADDYQGSDKLRDRVALITGGDSGIGRAVAVLYAREGADVAIVYLDEHPDAQETRRCVEAEGRRCLL